MPGRIKMLIFTSLITALSMAGHVIAVENQLIKSVGRNMSGSPETVRSASSAVNFNYQLKKPAVVDLFICDLDGRIVRRLFTAEPMEAGDHEAQWDGADQDGDACPTGTFIPILKARHDVLGYEVYDPTQKPWGHWVDAEAVQYDPESQTISFRLPRPAICLIRTGSGDGGPLYKTVAQWIPLDAGDHALSWDGWDQSRIVEVFKTEGFRVVIDAMSLPENAILLNNGVSADLNNPKAYELYPLNPPVGKEIFIHSLHARSSCMDFDIDVSVMRQGKRISPKTLKGVIQIQVDVPEDYARKLLYKEGLEGYLFVDGELAYEMRFDALPVVLNLDTGEISNGEHVFTVNLRSIEDHLGTWSIKGRVKN